jgi:hypothetical protein
MQARTQPIEAINQAEALRFLQALGKDPAAAWFRSIRHGKGANKRRKGADLHGFDAAELEADSRAGNSLYMVIGDANTCTGTAISDSDITSCPALFAEWDSGTAAEQQAAIEASGLPEPSILNHTGGKSLHAYWLLQEPISPEQWKEVTARLIAHTGADPKCCNPSRVMRLPGSTYYDKKTGRPTGTASTISAPGTRYQLAQLVAALAVEQTNERPRPATPARNEFPPRQLQEIEAAAQYIPERVVGGDTYETSRRALCGCAAALAEIGLPEAQALDLLAGKWPDRATAEQALNSSSTRNPAAFWAIAKQHGFDLSRKLKVIPGGRSTGQQAAPAATQASAPGTLPASFEQLIHNLPDGWVVTDEGLRPSKIRVGEMARLIEGKAGELLRFNEMTMYVEANTSAGWLKVDDAGMDAAYVLLDQKGWIIGLESVIKAICHVARQRTIHPVRQYLDRVAADPTIEPLDLTTLVGQFLRPNDRPNDPAGMLYGRMLAKTIVGAVARAMKPGCKVDTCCTLVGEQGAKKSTFWEALAGTAFYSSSSLGNLEKDALLLVHSVWFLEAAELECITGKKAAGEIKAFLSTKVDHFRRPYNRSIDGYDRPSIVVGTSNRDDFLVDTTGSRRFWIIPVTATKIDVEGVRAIRDRIWKAAVIAYRQGQRWWLDQADETASEEENKLFAASHPWEGPISDWLNSQKPEQFTSAEALVQAGLRKADQIQKRDEMAMATVLTGLRWVQCRVQEGGTRKRVWRPG